MLRPSFPQWYYGHEVPEQFPNSDVTAIVDETWKVGDLVDWFTTGCYWSGTITKLLNKNMVEVSIYELTMLLEITRCPQEFVCYSHAHVLCNKYDLAYACPTS
jgi:beta-xylosidase